MSSLLAPSDADAGRNEAVMPAGLRLQQRAARTLTHALRARAGHAYLLSGSRGAGTVDAAMWIAAASLCPNGGGDNCDVCRRVQRRVHPDLIWLQAEGQLLAREQIDLLIDQLVRRPFEAGMQVAVIDDAETLSSTNAITGNTLLKVLEEPPGDVLFVLLANSSAQLLPTLRSRVIEVPFPPLADAVLRAHLTELGVNEAALAANRLTLDAVVRMARGDVTRATELCAGGPTLYRHQVVTNIAVALASGQTEPAAAAAALLQLVDAAQSAAAELAEQEFQALIDQMVAQEGNRFRNSKDSEGFESRVKRRARRAMSDEIRLVLGELAMWYRDLLAVGSGADDTVINLDCLPTLVALRGSNAATRAVAALDAIEELPGRLSTNIDLPIAVAALCAELAGLGENRIRARRTLGAPSRTPAGMDVAISS